MDFPVIDFTKKQKRTIIFAVTLGNLLEWYEIYLYIYWTPILSRLFFDSDSDLANMTNIFLIFAIGFLARPLGGLFFGRLGDRVGRKKALILSIMMMTIPTFVTGLLPTHAQIGWAAPVILGLMRIFQSFPAGGELPGAFCYLYESANNQNKKYMCSWASVSFQLGILISTVECFFLDAFLPHDALVSWGWRVSFILGGCIGLFGWYLRYILHETPVYREMILHEKIVKESIGQVLLEQKKGIFKGILFCSLNSAAFYFLTVNFSVYFGQLLLDGSYYRHHLLIASLILLIITLPIPYLGKLADRWDARKMLIYSTIGLILLLYPFYLSMQQGSILFMAIIAFAFCMLFTVLSAIIPCIMSELFPTRVRFTCVGLSFNLVDAVIGGFTPVISLWLIHLTGNQGSFCAYLLLCAVLSLTGYLMLPKVQKAH